MIEPKIPDFSSWTTGRLKFLLIDYREALRTVRILSGKNSEDAQVYEAWIKAMEAELAKRESTR